jgi:hypothetical protein
VGIRLCTVSFDDGTGIRHSVQVSAESMFEAAALALHVFKSACMPPGLAAHQEIAVQAPVVNHSVSVQRLADIEREIAEGASAKSAAARTRASMAAIFYGGPRLPEVYFFLGL